MHCADRFVLSSNKSSQHYPVNEAFALHEAIRVWRDFVYLFASTVEVRSQMRRAWSSFVLPSDVCSAKRLSKLRTKTIGAGLLCR